MLRKVLLLLLIVGLNTFVFSQSNKAKKAHEAIKSSDFQKATKLISDLIQKNDERTLVYFLKYEFYISEKNSNYNLDSAFLDLQNAINRLQLEESKLSANYAIDFSFSLAHSESQLKQIYFLGYQSAKISKNIKDYEHFITNFGDNDFKPIALKALDTLYYQLYKSYNSPDSLYNFKRRFKNSDLLDETNELIVDFKLKNCKPKNDISCYEAILREFPRSQKSSQISYEIIKINDSLCEKEFDVCKKLRSINCFIELKQKYPKTKIINEIDFEIDNLNYAKFVNNNIDSVLFFISNYKESSKLEDAKKKFSKLFEDSVIQMNQDEKVFDFIELSEKFLTTIKSYQKFNPQNTQFNEVIDSLVFRSVQYYGIEGYDWYLKEFPNTKNAELVVAENAALKTLNNVAFLKENQENKDSKYGLIHLSTGSLLFGFFFEDVKGFSNDLAAVKLYDKWGFVNRQGYVEIPFVYDDVNSFTTEITGVCKDGVWYFINKMGITISDKEYLKIGEYGTGLFNVKSFSGSWQFLNSSEEVQSISNYYNASSFINGLAAVSPEDGRIQIIDAKFNVIKDGLIMHEYRNYYGDIGSRSVNIESFEYSERLNKYIINSQIFYSRNTNSSEIDEPANPLDFLINDIKFDENGDYLIDGRGIICYSSLKPIFDYALAKDRVDIFFKLNGEKIHPINPINNYSSSYSSYYNNYELWLDNYKSKLVLKNDMQISATRKLVSFNRESIVYHEALGYVLSRINGIEIIKNAAFQYISVLSNGIAIVTSEAGRYLMNAKGEKVSKLYRSIERINSNIFIAGNKDENNYFLINTKGQELSAHYDIIIPNMIKNNFIVKNIVQGSNYYNKKYEIGYIDVSGKVIIPVIYDELIHVPGQLIFMKCTDCDNRDIRTYEIFDYSGSKIYSITPGYRYSYTNINGSFFHKNTYKPNSEQIIKTLVIKAPLFEDL